MSGHHSGAPPGKGAGAGANRPRDVERRPSSCDVGSLPLDPGDPALVAAADWALATGTYVYHEDAGVVLLSDIFVAQCVANHAPPLPETWRLVRADRRALWAFRVPEGSWAA